MLDFIGHPRLAGGVPIPDMELDISLALRPLGFLYGATARAGCAAGIARPLVGDAQAFTSAQIFIEQSGRVHHALGTMAQLRDWAAPAPPLAARLEETLAQFGPARARFAMCDPARPLLMGIVNVTPDSFSDGGRFPDVDTAVSHARALIDAGADIIDIGGESTRPGADPTDPGVELERVMPVLRRLESEGAALSVDTRHAAVMEAAISAGATIVNDVSALTDDRKALHVVAESDASVILMHKKGDPRTMQEAPEYRHAPYEIYRYLRDRVAACIRAGIPKERISVDPGIGFGKTVAHNAQLVAHLAMLHGLGCVVTLGASRKMSSRDAGAGRLPGSIAALLAALDQGVQIHRVHDVAAAAEAIRTHARIRREY